MSHAIGTPRTTTSTLATGDGFAWLSWLRVAAIGAVVLIHTAGLTAVAPDARSTVHGWLAIALDFSSRWSVPAFVMMSGALLLDPARYLGTADFLRRRALRLVPAVIAWHLIYLFYVIVIDGRDLSVSKATSLIITGQLFTALYFFWIVLGLALITPLLMPWVGAASPRARILVGVGACALPALAVLTAPLRGLDWRADASWVQTPWTWFIPYLGYYLLGYALRDIVLTGWRLAIACSAAIAGCALLTWQWETVGGARGWLEHYMPAEAYYSPLVIAITVSVFLVARALIRPAGVLRVLCRPGPTRIGRRLGDATLGVFAVHLLVLEFMYQLPKVGGDAAAGSVQQLLARCVFVFVGAYAISLAASRIPVLRRIF